MTPVTSGELTPATVAPLTGGRGWQDPKLTDWLWEIRERARQYKRSRNYQKLLRASAPPKEQYKEPCFDEMENFLTYGVRHLNHSERVRLDAERYMETRVSWLARTAPAVVRDSSDTNS